MAAMNRPNELRMHLLGALNNGATVEEIQETMLQTAVYCGLPTAIEATRIAEEILRSEGRL